MRLAQIDLSVFLVVIALMATLAACEGPGEARPGIVAVDPESETVSVSGTGTGSGSGTGTGSGSVSGPGTTSGAETADGTATGTETAAGTGTGSGSGEIYAEVSNVDAYFNFSLDLRDIKELIEAGDWAGATARYETGEAVVRSDGTLRSLQSLAVSDTVLAIFPNGAEVYGDPQFLDAHIQAGLQGTGRGAGLPDAARRQLVDKGIQAVIYAKALQEIEAARTRTAEGNTDNGSGAPLAVDEAAAIYLGPKNEEGIRAFSLSNTARSREGNFGLEGKLDVPLQTELAAMLQAAQAGDAAQFEEAEAKVRGYLNSIFYLAALRYARSSLDAAVADRPVPLAEGWAFFQAIRANVAEASPETADRLNELFSSAPESVPDTIVTEVYGGLNDPAVLEALGVPPELQVQ
jgi:hypothetical protein